MRAILLTFPILIVFAAGSCNTNSYENAKDKIEQKERVNYKKFLSINSKSWINLIDETVIEGDIKSTATVAKYKDISLVINFYSKTDTKVGSETRVIYEFLNPGQSLHFKEKMYAPNGTKKLNVSIKHAKVVK